MYIKKMKHIKMIFSYGSHEQIENDENPDQSPQQEDVALVIRLMQVGT
jgi:hypothetical protein